MSAGYRTFVFLSGCLFGYGLSLFAQAPVIRETFPVLRLDDPPGYMMSVFPGQPYNPSNPANQPIDYNAYIPLVRCLGITSDAGGR